MNLTTNKGSISKDHTNWKVPAYEVLFWEQRKQDYCVVIPVINEGNRIISLIDKMSVLKIEQFADIIIIDGGSTDGSLEPTLLTSKGVKGLLQKTGPGKLSAQLRCGYAFALEQGYEGIITIDGNDKDDPDPISDFINTLKKGVDFIQASRYIEGGAQKNTPKSRDFAIRYIHAPMLSLFSRFRWTDTTQGFRAYSRKLLLDERIAPFRDIFMTYELLAYLSYRAPKLGFLCIELPTNRQYPQGEIPTKINGMRDNFSLLVVLFRACFGFYNPR